MSLILELTQEEETHLREQASHYGSEPETLAIEWIRSELTKRQPSGTPLIPKESGTLYDALKEYIGVGDSSQFGSATLPRHCDPYEQELAQIFAEKYDKKEQNA